MYQRVGRRLESLCRDGADMPYMPYEKFTTAPTLHLLAFLDIIADCNPGVFHSLPKNTHKVARKHRYGNRPKPRFFLHLQYRTRSKNHDFYMRRPYFSYVM